MFPLLDAIPITSILATTTTILVGLIGYFLKDAYSKLNRKQDEMEKALFEINQTLNKETRRLEDKLNDTHIKLLDKFQDIKDTINNARK